MPLRSTPEAEPTPGEVDHQYPRLRPKYPPPPPNSSNRTTIIRINSIGVSFDCAGVTYRAPYRSIHQSRFARDASGQERPVTVVNRSRSVAAQHAVYQTADKGNA